MASTESSEITKPVSYFNCLNSDSYIRSCKLIKEGNSLLVGGESSSISMWDLDCGGTPKLKVGFLLVYLSAFL